MKDVGGFQCLRKGCEEPTENFTAPPPAEDHGIDGAGEGGGRGPCGALWAVARGLNFAVGATKSPWKGLKQGREVCSLKTQSSGH